MLAVNPLSKVAVSLASALAADPQLVGNRGLPQRRATGGLHPEGNGRDKPAAINVRVFAHRRAAAGLR